MSISGAIIRSGVSAAAAVMALLVALYGARAEATGGHPKRTEADAAIEAILALEADVDYGAYLAGDCAACHRASGGGDGIPPIAGLPADYIVNALVEYKLKIRDNEVMVVRTSRLGDDEIAALAAHFAAQNP